MDTLFQLRKKLYINSFFLLVILITTVWLVLFLPFHFEHKEKKERELDYLLYSKKVIIENYLELSGTQSNYASDSYLKKIINDYKGFGIEGESLLGRLKNGIFTAIFETRHDDILHKVVLSSKEWSRLLSGREHQITADDKEMIIKATKIEGTDLILMVAIDKNEFYSYVDNRYHAWLVVAFLIAVFGVYGITAITGTLFEKLKSEIDETLMAKEELEIYKNELEERVRQEVETREAKEKLLIEQSKMATMGQMIGFITHQWKQPITTISLLLDSLNSEIEESGTSDTEGLKTTIKNIESQITYMGQTINDFASFLKPSKTKTTFTFEKIIEDIRRLILPKMYKYNVVLETNLQDVEIEGYENEFKHALLNIINNAIDSIERYRESKELKKYEYEGVIKIDVKKDKRGLVISIADNGEGFKVDNIDQIYEPYFSTKGEKGDGIGLYMSKLIIENYMKGHIIAYNNSEGGATFEIVVS